MEIILLKSQNFFETDKDCFNQLFKESIFQQSIGWQIFGESKNSVNIFKEAYIMCFKK